MPPTKKQSNEERLRKKREAEKRRQEKIKANPELYEAEKRKSHIKYLNRKKKGQVRPIVELSRRERRQKRKQWRINSEKYRHSKLTKDVELSHQDNKEQQEKSFALTPGSSSLTPNMSRKVAGRKNVRKDRSAAYRQLKKAQEQVKKYMNKAQMYKRRLERLQSYNDKISGKKAALDTPRTKVRKLLKGTRVSPVVKKRLLFGEILKAQLDESYKMLGTKHNPKQLFHKILCGKVIKKYRCLRDCRSFLKFKSCNKNGNYLDMYQRKRKITFQGRAVKDHVKVFLEHDENSRLCPGKRDTITRGGSKKQKRYLNDSLKSLHGKFVAEHEYTISYSLFCKLRPFWIVEPQITDRDTCLCILHSNTKMLVEKLQLLKVIESKTPHGLVNTLCCNPQPTETCLLRRCVMCCKKKITFLECDFEAQTFYHQWVTKKEARMCKNKEIFVHKTSKDRLETTIGEMVNQLQSTILKYMHHVANIKHQFHAMDCLKEGLLEHEVLVHVDFSQNYSCKYSEEAQSVHFGASRAQITLHTGTYYYKDAQTLKVQSFCTLSESLKHDPSAIWAHLQPVLLDIAEKVPKLTTIHFQSDSPSMQYRNKTMFYLLTSKLNAILPQIRGASWNFSEAGHGKGAPDGVGAVLKRTADKYVARGVDIPDFQSLFQVMGKYCPGVQLHVVNEDMIQNIVEELIYVVVKPFPGTMKVHQVTWCSHAHQILTFRTLSCFECGLGTSCKHFNIGKAFKPLEKSLHNFPIQDSEDSPPCSPYSFESSSNQIEDIPDTNTNHSRGDWVVVRYDNDEYPGEVLKVEESYITVSVMQSAGLNNFKWPKPMDIHSYPKMDITRKITGPIPRGSRGTHFYFNDFP